jgi:hypothetical protein
MKNYRSAKRTEISIEKCEVTVIRIRRGTAEAFCHQCLAISTYMTPQQVSAIFEMPLGQVYRDLETGRFHVTKTDMNVTQICASGISGISGGHITKKEK